MAGSTGKGIEGRRIVLAACEAMVEFGRVIAPRVSPTSPAISITAKSSAWVDRPWYGLALFLRAFPLYRIP